MDLKPEIILKRYAWTFRDNLYITGTAVLGGEMITKEDLPEILSGHTRNFSQFTQFCRTLGGQLSIVVQKENETWIYVGHTWSYPLFFTVTPSFNAVSDIPEALIESGLRPEPDQHAETYFRAFGVTPGSRTLDKNIRQVRPGETLQIDHSTGLTKSWPNDMPQPGEKKSHPEELAGLIRERFKIVARHIGNRQVLLPLTGGYDSRLLACLLRESGIDRVLCATWGRTGNPDAIIAEKISKILGYRHIFIPIDDHEVEIFPQQEDFSTFAAFAGHFSSMPYLQDFFAVRHLLRKGEIDHETIVLPGHPGDYIRGSHLYPRLLSETPEATARSIIAKFGSTLPFSKQEKKLLTSTIIREIFKTSDSCRQNFDRWDQEERQCKFIGNSSQVYTWAGLSHLMPLFDREITEFMLCLPFGQRLQAKLYNQTLETQFFHKQRVDHDLKKINHAYPGTSPVKNLLISLAPRFVKKWYYPMEDPVGYREYTSTLRESFPGMVFSEPERPNAYNAYLIQWYIQWIRKRYPTTL
jgi:asparagine synthase (glutamine-hydrolysing)